MGYCICPYGFTSSGCYTPTCPLPTQNASDNALGQFFTLCYGTTHGFCFNGQPRMCACEAGWGPPASMVPTLPFYTYQQFPCFFPSSATHLSDLFVINSVLYNDSTTPGSVCGGFSHGQGISIGNIGYCQCVQIPLLNPASLIRSQNAYDGAACTGPVSYEVFQLMIRFPSSRHRGKATESSRGSAMVTAPSVLPASDSRMNWCMEIPLETPPSAPQVLTAASATMAGAASAAPVPLR
jgi:hypothetical protein